MIKSEAERLQVIPQLEAFNTALSVVEIDKKQGSLHLIVLDLEAKEVSVKSYSRQSLEEASRDYLKEETQIENQSKRQVVLVSSDSLDSLRKAYPSYFLDTQEFVKKLSQIIKFAKQE
mgnify:CR=1 FL=1